MTDRKFELTRRQILGATGAIGIASAGAGLGTSALFSDEEAFENNELVAGELDLYVHYETSVSQGGVDTGSTTETDTIQGDPATGEYVIKDVKPGDSGTLVFCFSIVDNPAFLRMGGQLTANDENEYTEPEPDTEDGGDVNDPGTEDGGGELADAIEAQLAYCDEDGNQLDIADPVLRSDSLRNVLSGLRLGVPLDGAPGSDEREPFDGGDTTEEPTDDTCVCLTWEVPTEVGNEIQTDSVGFDLSFYGEQSRHNDGVDLANGLVGHYPLDTVWDGVADDVSGNGYDGEIDEKVSSVEGQVWNAASLDGDGDYVRIESNDRFQGGSDATISAFAWINAESAGGDPGAGIVGKQEDATDGDWGLVYSSNPPGWADTNGSSPYVGYYSESGGADYGLYEGTGVENNQWHHVGFVLDQANGSLALYLDGDEVRTDENLPTVSAQTSAEVEIGAVGYKPQYFEGTIDHVLIYDRALSESEVETLYETTMD